MEGETSTVEDEEEGDGEDRAKNNVVLLALETSDSDAAHQLRLLVCLYITLQNTAAYTSLMNAVG